MWPMGLLFQIRRYIGVSSKQCMVYIAWQTYTGMYRYIDILIQSLCGNPFLFQISQGIFSSQKSFPLTLVKPRYIIKYSLSLSPSLSLSLSLCVLTCIKVLYILTTVNAYRKTSAMIKDGQANFLPCKSIDECFNMFAPCSRDPSHLNLLAKVHGHLYLGHYVQQVCNIWI